MAAASAATFTGGVVTATLCFLTVLTMLFDTTWLRRTGAVGACRVHSGRAWRVTGRYQLNGFHEAAAALFSIPQVSEAIDAYFADAFVRSLVLRGHSILSEATLISMSAVEARARIARFHAVATIVQPILTALPSAGPQAALGAASASGDPIPVPLFRR